MLLAILIVTLTLLVGFFLLAFVYLRLPKFGALPEGDRLERVLASPHFRQGRFQNIFPVRREADSPDSSSTLLRFFTRSGRIVPQEPLPSVHSDLRRLEDASLVWFGHSTFLLRLGGRTLLADPAFSPSASPVGFATKAFPGSSPFVPSDLPDIDFLLISHDHWDHLDYPSVMAFKPRIGKVFCGLGVGAHFQRWGFSSEAIQEGQWGDAFEPLPGFRISFVYARHFSGRGFKWDRAMWTGYVIEAGGMRIFYSGDGGYSPHFKDIGQKMGPFDLAILEDGQYDKAWKDIHMMPEETVLAAMDLGARALLPVHNSKFSIAYHDWDDPLIRVSQASKGRDFRLLTPVIGQVVVLKEPTQEFVEWWTSVK
jgi:L-ascorbate metabolism protein UlaG (beta-lactamase superfamily)